MPEQEVHDDPHWNDAISRTGDDDARHTVGMYPDLAKGHHNAVRIGMTTAATAFELGV